MMKEETLTMKMINLLIRNNVEAGAGVAHEAEVEVEVEIKTVVIKLHVFHQLKCMAEMARFGMSTLQLSTGVSNRILFETLLESQEQGTYRQ